MENLRLWLAHYNSPGHEEILHSILRHEKDFRNKWAATAYPYAREGEIKAEFVTLGKVTQDSGGRGPGNSLCPIFPLSDLNYWCPDKSICSCSVLWNQGLCWLHAVHVKTNHQNIIVSTGWFKKLWTKSQVVNTSILAMTLTKLPHVWRAHVSSLKNGNRSNYKSLLHPKTQWWRRWLSLTKC